MICPFATTHRVENIQIVGRGKIQDLKVTKEMVGVLRGAGSSIECQPWPRIAVPVLGDGRNGSARRNDSLPPLVEDEL